MTEAAMTGTPFSSGRRPPESRRPRILIVAGRGEVLRNFMFSDTLPRLAEEADVSVLSVVDGDAFVDPWRDHVEEVIRLEEYPEMLFVSRLRNLTENAHDRWLWSAVARNHWHQRDRRARAKGRIWRRRFIKLASRALAFRPALRALTRLDQELVFRLRTTRTFDRLIARLEPDLVFNGSHIHGWAAELPLRVAARQGVRTAGFIFSWDNLTSRSRIFVPYDDVLVWTEGIRRHFLEIYPEVSARRVAAVGTPQFDYHFKPDCLLSRAEICRRIGIDPDRPFVLYTTGVDNDFPQEHRHVEQVARLSGQLEPRPQLVVRTYTKGTSREMAALAEAGLPDVVFPPALWDAEWQTPHHEDLAIFTSLLKHCALGINAASTVSLELMIFDKPIINLRFDPPGSDLPRRCGYERHILFDHFRPVAESGATMVAGSGDDLAQMLQRGLSRPEADSSSRKRFLAGMFGNLLDGRAGIRVAELLLKLARQGGRSRA